MLLRVLALILGLSSAGWYLAREQRAGRFQRVDELFLDFLVGSSRGVFEKAPSGAQSEVVLVRLRVEDAAEFASWPPPPIDWNTLLKGLRPYEPKVVLITHPLNWGSPAPDFLPALADTLLPLSGVVMAVEAQAAEAEPTAPPFMGGLEEAMPRFQRVDGPVSLAPALGTLIAAPDDRLRRLGQLGLLGPRLNADGTWRLPYAMREGGRLVPSVVAQSLAAYSQTPYARHRLRLGPGAGACLNEGLFVPLQPNGEFAVPVSGATTTINGLDLMAGTLVDGISDVDKAKLSQAQIVVIGLDHDNAASPPSAARLHADALTHLLSLPRIRVLSTWEQWAAWGVAALAAFAIVLGVSRRRAVAAGLGLVFAALVVSFVAFQSQLLWCPPTIPVAFILVGTLVGRVFGRPGKLMAELPPPGA